MKKRLIADSFIALFGAVLLFLLFMHYGRIQFGGMDGSVLVNSAWMLKLGYRPYSDFLTAVPPLFLLGTKAIGIGRENLVWSYFLEFTCAFSIVTFTTCFYLLRRVGQSLWISFASSLLIQLCGLGLYTVWWYNAATGTICALLLLALFVATSEQIGAGFRCLIIFLQGMVLCAKVNSAFLTFIFSAIYLCKLGGRKKVFPNFFFHFLSPIVIVFIVLEYLHTSGIQMLLNYQDWSGRIQNLSTPLKYLRIPTPNSDLTFQNYAVILPILFLAIIKSFQLLQIKGFPRFGFKFYLFVFSICLFLQSIILDNDLKVSFVGALIGLVSADLRKNFERQLYLGFCVIALVYASFAIHSRQRVEAVGPGLFYQANCEWRYDRFWGKFCGSDVFWRLNNDLTRFKEKYLSKGKVNVFFGPRIDFAYAYLNLEPIREMPLWWEAYTFTERKNFKPIEVLYSSKVDILVFFKDDMTFMPDISKYIDQCFSKEAIGDLRVYLRVVRVGCE